MSTLKNAIEQFYSAHNEIFEGDLAPMEEIWSHEDDVTYMSPIGGYWLAGMPHVIPGVSKPSLNYMDMYTLST